MTMAQRQSIHRQSIEKSVIASNIANEKIGMYLAAFLTFCMIVAGVILIICDKPVIGFISIFAPAFFHASNYIYNKRQENQIRDEEQIKPKPKE
ncbi:hypothetical protein H3C70_05390 [Patescibacteria group bacterium]|nr:hypothetical protein [Patescibacteria group bacterium]